MAAKCIVQSMLGTLSFLSALECPVTMTDSETSLTWIHYRHLFYLLYKFSFSLQQEEIINTPLTGTCSSCWENISPSHLDKSWHFLCGSIKYPLGKRNWCHSHLDIFVSNIKRFVDCFNHYGIHPKTYCCIIVCSLNEWLHELNLCLWKLQDHHFPFISTVGTFLCGQDIQMPPTLILNFEESSGLWKQQSSPFSMKLYKSPHWSLCNWKMLFFSKERM